MTRRVRRQALAVCVLSTLCGLLGASAYAQVPQLIRYQGTLVDANNVPIEGTVTLTFRLYGAATGGTAVWTETQSAIPVSRGVFNVLLGQVTPLTLTFEKDYWLSTQVNTDVEMSPRQRLTSVPYAYRAAVADQLDQRAKFQVDTTGTLTTGLVAYWKLDESSGSRADSKGTNALTDTNTVTQAAGKVGNAAQLTATNSEYLSRTDNADLSVGDIDFTFACWAYLDSVVNDMIIFSKHKDGTQIEYELRYRFNEGFRFGVSNDGTALVTVTSSGAVATGAWYFIMAWHDATANTINLQVNNGVANSLSHTTGVIDGTQDFKIGTRGEAAGNGLFWSGRIDEVGFWKRVFTAQERADLYNGGNGNTYQPGPAPNPWQASEGGIHYAGGKVGIGTANPRGMLELATASADPLVIAGTPSSGWFLALDSQATPTPRKWVLLIGSNGKFHIVDATVDALRLSIDTAGNVGIGAPDPAGYKLYVNGSAYATGGWYGSSAALKTDIRPLVPADYTVLLHQLNQLEVVRFRWKDSLGMDTQEHLGIIAEQAPVEITNPDKTAVSASDYLAFLAASLKALKAKHDVLQATVLRLQNQLDALRTGDTHDQSP